MKNYLIGLVITLGISGCVSIPSIDFSQQKLKGLIQLKIGLVLIPPSQGYAKWQRNL